VSANTPGGRAVISAQRVRMADDAVHVAAPHPDGTLDEPKIQLVREDGVVRAIDVTCRCGEKIRIVCEY